MKGNDLLKIGFWGLLIYGLLRESNQPSNNVDYNNPGQFPQFSPNSLTRREQVYRALQESIAEVKANLTSRQPSVISLLAPKPPPDPQTIEASNWLRLIKHPSIVIILGKRGSGKSALGYRLLQLLRWTANLYVVGLPKDARKYLPDWIGMATRLEEVPVTSIGRWCRSIKTGQADLERAIPLESR